MSETAVATVVNTILAGDGDNQSKAIQQLRNHPEKATAIPVALFYFEGNQDEVYPVCAVLGAVGTSLALIPGSRFLLMSEEGIWMKTAVFEELGGIVIKPLDDLSNCRKLIHLYEILSP